jgi:anti-sigma-K factor RskA
MTGLDHSAARELAAPYALDALDEDELRAFEQHLADCSECRQEVDELREAAAALAAGVDPVEPPPALRGRILAEARRGGDVVPLRRRRTSLAPPLLAAAAAAAAVVAVGLGIWSGSLSRSLDEERSARAAERAALAIAAEPSARRVAVSGARGALYVTPSGRAALALVDLEPPPEGKTYEAWVFEGDTPRPAGTFRGRAAVLSRSVPAGAKVAVTVERAGGVARPTGQPVLQTRA